MKKGINARAWFYSQSFHSNLHVPDQELDAAQERARARAKAMREALNALDSQPMQNQPKESA